jgi:N-acetylglucosamine-6-phosphate deacetylase
MTAARHAIAADYVFDGVVLHRAAAVMIDGADVAALMPRAELPASISVHALPAGAWLAPGFIDIQVNGGGDVLFNDEPTARGARAIAAAHRRFGTTAILPTLITDTPDKMKAALAAAGEAVAGDPAILGVHLEGPFISPEKLGVHDARYVRAPDAQDEAMLLAPRGGVTVVTLAPEQVPPGFVARLSKAGIRVCLGHSNATYAQTRAAMAEGLSGFTHLFNAMRAPASREPGPIPAALESPAASFGMIVDGVHVDPVMLRLALRGVARPILVTDAMPPVGGTRPAFALYGEEMTVQDGRCLRRDGTLAGAFLTMADAVRNCVDLLGVPLTDALRFASGNPASFIGMDKRLGRLAAGYRADLVALEPKRLDVLKTWIAGRDD